MLPFRSEKQRRYMWKFHPDIAKRWTAEYGSTPQPSSGQGQKHNAKADYQGLTPGPITRHTPKRATEQQASDERERSIVMPGTGGGPLGAAKKHRGLKGRDVRASARRNLERKG